MAGDWRAVPSQLFGAFINSSAIASTTLTVIRPTCIPLTVAAPTGLPRIDACDTARRFVWPALALNEPASRALTAAADGPRWSISSFALEAAEQATVAIGLRSALVPRYRVSLVSTPTARANGCLLGDVHFADVSGLSTELVFRIENVTAALASRLTNCSRPPNQTLSWNVSLRVDALVWGATFQQPASPITALDTASVSAALGIAELSNGMLSLPPATDAQACRFVVPSMYMSSADGSQSPVALGANDAVVVSDALPPVVLELSAPVPPAAGETLSTSCELLELSSSATHELVSLDLISSAITQSASARIRISGLFQFGVAAPYPQRFLQLACLITSQRASASVFPAYTASMAVNKTLVFVHARWPLFENAIIHYGDVPDGRALDLSDSGRVMVTEPLPFAITTPTSVNVTLVGDTRHWLREGAAGQFTRDTLVFVGGVKCRTYLDELPGDGSRLKFRMPLFNEVCGSNTSTCSPLVLTVTNPIVADLAVQVSCPPFCPDGLRKPPAGLPLAIGIASVVSVRSSSGGARRLLDATSRVSMVAPADPDSTDLDLVRRVTYVSECVNGTFTDIRLPACSNASDPRSYNCALGTRDECVKCPSFALCRGDGSMRPRAGFYTTSETSRDITPCAPPADRCLGWNASSNAVICAPRFRPRSTGCGVCADMHFPTLDGDCAPCAASLTIDSVILSAIGIVLGAMLGVVVALVGGAWLAIRVMEGGTVKNVVKRGVQLLVILVTGMQVQVVVSERASSGLPSFLTGLYRYLQIFTFANLGVHPACTGKYGVFRVQLSLFFAATALLALQLVLLVNWRRVLGCKCCGLRKRELDVLYASAAVDAQDVSDSSEGTLDTDSPKSGARHWFPCVRGPSSISQSQRRLEVQRESKRKQRKLVLATQPWHVRLGVTVAERKPALRRLLFVVSTLMFPAVVSNILQSLHCVSKDVSVRDYRNLGQDGSTLRTLGIAERPTLQLNGATGQVSSNADSERIIRVRVLAHDPYFVCAEGEHRLVSAWAFFLLAVYVIAQPLATFFVSRAALARLVADAFPDKHHQALEADRQRQRAYLDDAGEGLGFVARKLYAALCCGGRRYARKRDGEGGSGTLMGQVAPTFDTRNPLQSPGVSSAPAASPAASPVPVDAAAGAARAIVTADDLVDRAVADGKCADSAVEFFLRGDFRATRYWVRHVDLLLLLLLTVANKAWPQPAGIDARVSSVILRACMAWTAIGATALVYAAQQPFTPGNAFMRNVKLLHFGVIAELEAVNLVNAMLLTRKCQSLEAIGLTECQATSFTGIAGPLEASLSLPALEAAQSVLSALAFALALLFFVVAVGSVVRALYGSIEREASEQHQEEVAAAVAALQRPDGVGALVLPTARVPLPAAVAVQPIAAAAVKLATKPAIAMLASPAKPKIVRIDLEEEGGEASSTGDTGHDNTAAGGRCSTTPARPEALLRAKAVLADPGRERRGESASAGVSMRGDFSAMAVRSGSATSQT